jgi:hypothetical protein
MRRLGLDEMERECGSQVQGVELCFISQPSQLQPSSHMNFSPIPTLYFQQRAQPPSRTVVLITHHRSNISHSERLVLALLRC